MLNKFYESYEWLSHDEILSEHAQRYEQMTRKQRVEQARERDRRILEQWKAWLPLKWKNSIFIGLVLFGGLIALEVFTGKPTSTLAFLFVTVIVVGYMIAEASHKICARLESIKENVSNMRSVTLSGVHSIQQELAWLKADSQNLRVVGDTLLMRTASQDTNLSTIQRSVDSLEGSLENVGSTVQSISDHLSDGGPQHSIIYDPNQH